MITLNGKLITPTIFPDGTSQVWKLSKELVDYIKTSSNISIMWEFDDESELFHVLQLQNLVWSLNNLCEINLSMPYLPYARQDKSISNETTFALQTFLNLIKNKFDTITVYDPYNATPLVEKLGGKVIFVSPKLEIEHAIVHSFANAICYPDKGASLRYPFLNNRSENKIVMDKVRDQLTGDIIGIEVVSGVEHVPNADILLCHDLCDWGQTFVEAAKVLYKLGAKTVHLYVSHGLFTHPSGINFLKDEGGIVSIYTKEGRVC